MGDGMNYEINQKSPMDEAFELCLKRLSDIELVLRAACRDGVPAEALVGQLDVFIARLTEAHMRALAGWQGDDEVVKGAHHKRERPDSDAGHAEKDKRLRRSALEAAGPRDDAPVERGGAVLLRRDDSDSQEGTAREGADVQLDYELSERSHTEAVDRPTAVDAPAAAPLLDLDEINALIGEELGGL